ncbi:MAG: hypothetical protein JW909_06000 [Planctomycetes bacterium]|nr:hypothetical protein [Planctomycetota bacterium]
MSRLATGFLVIGFAVSSCAADEATPQMTLADALKTLQAIDPDHTRLEDMPRYPERQAELAQALWVLGRDGGTQYLPMLRRIARNFRRDYRNRRPTGTNPILYGHAGISLGLAFTAIHSRALPQLERRVIFYANRFANFHGSEPEESDDFDELMILHNMMQHDVLGDAHAVLRAVLDGIMRREVTMYSEKHAQGLKGWRGKFVDEIVGPCDSEAWLDAVFSSLGSADPMIRLFVEDLLLDILAKGRAGESARTDDDPLHILLKDKRTREPVLTLLRDRVIPKLAVQLKEVERDVAEAYKLWSPEDLATLEPDGPDGVKRLRRRLELYRTLVRKHDTGKPAQTAENEEGSHLLVQ